MAPIWLIPQPVIFYPKWHNALHFAPAPPAIKPKKKIFVNWKFPPLGWVKLNTDGCSKGNPGPAGAGGLIRDSNGYFVAGFTVNLGRCDAFEAELAAVLQGLSMAWRNGFRKIILELDSLLVVEWLNEQEGCTTSYPSLVSICREFLKLDWEVKVCHIYREGNRAADLLANEALSHAGTCEFNKPSTELVHILDEDLSGISLPRLVSI